MTARPFGRGVAIGIGVGLVVGALATVALTVAVTTAAGRSATQYRAGFSDRGLNPTCRILDGSRIVVEFTIDPLDGRANLDQVTEDGDPVAWRVVPLGEGFRPGEEPVDPLVIEDESPRDVLVEGPVTVLVAVPLARDEQLRAVTLSWHSDVPLFLQQVPIGARVDATSCKIAGVD
jgi:hypothetical protein